MRKWLLLAPALAILAVFALYPIVGAIATSRDYDRLLEEPEALDSIRYTLFFVSWSVTLEIVLGLAIALAIHRTFPAARASVLVPWALPTVVASMIWRYVFDDRYGILNYLLFGNDLAAYHSWLADPMSAQILIVAADVWKTTPFTALILLAGLQSIPEEYHEAARVDGAGAALRFFSITLPLLRPALLVALLFRTMDAFRVFDLVFVLTQGKGGTSVLQFLGYKVLFGRQDAAFGSAISCVVFGMIAIVAIFYVRLFREDR